MCVSRSAEAVNLPSATPHFISTQHMQKHPNVWSYLGLHFMFITTWMLKGKNPSFAKRKHKLSFRQSTAEQNMMQLQEKGWKTEVRRKVHSKPSSPSACTLQSGWEMNNYCKWWRISITGADFQLSKVLWKTHLHSDFAELGLPNIFISPSYLKMECFSVSFFWKIMLKMKIINKILEFLHAAYLALSITGSGAAEFHTQECSPLHGRAELGETHWLYLTVQSLKLFRDRGGWGIVPQFLFLMPSTFETPTCRPKKKPSSHHPGWSGAAQEAPPEKEGKGRNKEIKAACRETGIL